MKIIPWSIHGCWLVAAFLIQPMQSFGQSRDRLILVGSGGDTVSVAVVDTRGHRAVTHNALEKIGWTIEIDREGLRTAINETERVRFFFDSPFFYWNDEVLQLVDSPVLEGLFAQIPLQFFSRFCS